MRVSCESENIYVFIAPFVLDTVVHIFEIRNKVSNEA